jgi:hypothetical protein
LVFKEIGNLSNLKLKTCLGDKFPLKVKIIKLRQNFAIKTIFYFDSGKGGRFVTKVYLYFEIGIKFMFLPSNMGHISR